VTVTPEAKKWRDGREVVPRVPITGTDFCSLLIFARAASDFCHWNHEKLYFYNNLNLKIF
jgi:hypothetical protein